MVNESNFPQVKSVLPVMLNGFSDFVLMYELFWKNILVGVWQLAKVNSHYPDNCPGAQTPKPRVADLLGSTSVSVPPCPRHEHLCIFIYLSICCSHLSFWSLPNVSHNFWMQLTAIIHFENPTAFYPYLSPAFTCQGESNMLVILSFVPNWWGHLG